MNKLYQFESAYREALADAIYDAEEGLTLKEYLELGFNNSFLESPDETKRIEDLFMTSDTEYYRDDLTNEILDVRVKLDYTYEDFDGYTCGKIVLENEKDWDLFEPLLDEELEV